MGTSKKTDIEKFEDNFYFKHLQCISVKFDTVNISINQSMVLCCHAVDILLNDDGMTDTVLLLQLFHLVSPSTTQYR